MSVELPGIAKENLEVTLERDVLSVEGRTQFSPPDGYRVLKGNLVQRHFLRSFRLSDEIDRNGIEVEAKNGVAVFKLPKSTQAQRMKLSVK